MKLQFPFARSGNFADVSSSSTELVEMCVYALIAFFIPIVLQAHEQLVVGVVVNAALLAGAFYVRGLKTLPIIVLPSLGAIAAGALFGGLTPLLLIFAPMIWLGNAALVFVTKHCHFVKGWGYAKSVGSAIVVKVLILGGVALGLFWLNVIPAPFLYAMSVFQLATAVCAAVLFLPLFKARRAIGCK